METTIRYADGQSDSNAVFIADHPLRCSQGTVIHAASPARRLPPAADAGEAYYWTHAWQVAQQEALEALHNGEGVKFESASDAIRWLLSADED